MSEWQDKAIAEYKKKYTESYFSQNNEEFYIVNNFKEFIGIFTDIGANNGTMASNTYRLSQLGWSGVLIEPSKISFERLQETYKGNDKVKLMNIGIMPKAGTYTFWDSNGDGISTTDLTQKTEWSKVKGVDYKETKMGAISVEDLFNQIGYDTNFLSLDVEGINLELFRLIPFDKLTNLTCVCIEHQEQYKEIEDTLSKYGFKRVTLNPENIVLTR